jgi:hypothetical protein
MDLSICIPKKIPMKCFWAQGENFQNIGLKTYGWGFRKKVETLKLGCEVTPLGLTKIQFFCNESVPIWNQDAKNSNFGIKI